jgi:hypothetical protein
MHADITGVTSTYSTDAPMPMNPRLLRPLATGFNPLNIASLEGWWDASDLSSMAQNSDGTTAVTATNDPVGYWADKSGKGRHAKQATNNDRPLVQLADKNNRAGLDFDGNDDHYKCDSGAAFAAVYFVAVMRRTATPAAWNGIYVHRASGNRAGFSNGAQQFFVQQTSNLTAGFVFGIAEDGGFMRENGITVTAVNSGVFNLRHYQFFPNTTDTKVIGVQGNQSSTSGTQFPIIGLDPAAGGGRFYPMRAYEMMVFSAIPATAQLQALERHLGRKWGITVA